MDRGKVELMRLQPVNLQPGQAVFCCVCWDRASATSPKGPALADLDGEAFKAYYHADCAKRVQEESKS